MTHEHDNVNDPTTLTAIADMALKHAQQQGAQEVSVSVSEVKETEIAWRDNQVERLMRSTSRGLSLQLFVDGRYMSVGSSDLRSQALKPFIEESIAMTRALEPDPFRRLPDPVYYKGRQEQELQLEDPYYVHVSPEDRLNCLKEAESAAREQDPRIISVTTAYSDTLAHSVRMHSNGFYGEKSGTSFFVSAEVSVQDNNDKRPEESDYAGARFWQDLKPAKEIGLSAKKRALQRLGSTSLPSQKTTLVLENRVAGRLIGLLLSPLSAYAIQQKRSCFAQHQNQSIASSLLTIVDAPFVKKGFGSRLFDSEGLSAHAFPVIEAGILKNYYIDFYYGLKLGLQPTTASVSNLQFQYGQSDLMQLISNIKEGILVTGFLGGNSNATTGDFSLGILGFRIVRGQIDMPVSELNIAANQKDLWKQLVAVGNDPYPYSSYQTPSLVFDNVQVAGT